MSVDKSKNVDESKNVKLVGPGVVAEQLAVDPRTVKRWARQGRIPSFPITRKVVRFDLAEVMKSIGRPRA